MEEIKKGEKWRHYKHQNMEYEIVCDGRDSDTLNEVVVYKALYEEDYPLGQIWVRSKKDFLGMTIDKKTGKEVKRFKLVN